MRGINKKYHYVYKIINNLNGMEYIGVHSTDNLDDGYFGSGTYLKNAIRKYGKENYSKQILEFCDSRNGALDVERNLVKEDYVSSPNVYNLVLGGGIPLEWAKSISKYKKEEYYPKEDYENDIKNKHEKYRIDIPYERRLRFYIDSKNLKIQKIYLALYSDQIKRQYGNNYESAPYQLSIMISNFILDEMDDICKIMTDMYNDNRFHKKALKLLNQFNQKGLLDYCIKIKGLNVA